MNAQIDKTLPPGPALHTTNEIQAPSTDYSLAQLEAYFHAYGDIYKLPSPKAGQFIYVITRPAWVKHILSTNHPNYTKGIGIDRVKILLGNGIMVSEGEYWRKQRKMLQPAFHERVLSQLITHMRHGNEILLSKWQHASDTGTNINITADMSELALNFILHAIFSEDLVKLSQPGAVNPFTLVAEESNRDLQFARKFRELTRHISEIIEQRQTQTEMPHDFLSLMLNARDKKSHCLMSMKELLNETMTLIVAGHETTASALNWTWYLLAQHPDELAKVEDELNHVLNGKIPQWSDLNQLQYLKQVIHESLRLYPPGWLLTRRALAEDMLDNYDIAPKTDIFISPYLLQRHPQLWPQPERFNPERFHPEQIEQRHRFAYIPFAAGPRNCIGEELALAEMQFHLAFMLQHFKPEGITEQPIELEAQVNLRPKRPLFLQLHFRKKG